MPKSRVFHYTTGNKLSLIADSAALTPTNVMVAPDEKAVLWFSANPLYEPTAIKLIMTSDRKAYRPTVAQLNDIVGVFRFGLDAGDARLLSFSRLPRLAHISATDVSRMIASGLRIGATPAHWTGTLVPIAVSELTFEAWSDGAWNPAPLHETIARVQHNGKVIKSISAAAVGLTNMY